MYGSILRITNNIETAEKIFTDCFINLKHTDIVTQTQKKLLIFLLHHTHSCCAGNLNYQ